MISCIPTYSATQNFNPNPSKSLWFISYKSLNLLPLAQELFTKSFQSSRTMFGIPIYQQPQQKKEALMFANLPLAKKTFICGCYWAMNWQRVFPSELDVYLGSLPVSENKIEAIRTEGQYIKLQKNSAMVKISLDSHVYGFGDNIFELDSFDRTGKGEMLQYQLSIKKITINGVGYNFDGIIDQVESCQSFVAVRTTKSINIIYLKNNNSLHQTFSFPNCVDIKWGEKGLYCLMPNATILSIQMDIMNASNFGRFHPVARFNIPQTNVTSNYEFTNVAQINKIIVAFGVCKSGSEKNKGILVVVRSPEYGMSESDVFLCPLKEVENIVYSSLVVRKKQLCLVIVDEVIINEMKREGGGNMEENQEGAQNKLKSLKLHQYYFGTVLHNIQ